jgi:hypothetical protein
MIGVTLDYLRKILSEKLGADKAHPQLVFLSSQDDDSIKFPKDAISMLLINMEKEEHTRMDDPYRQKNKTTDDFFQVYPEIRLNLYLLFVSNWGDYKTGLDRLSEVITFFQANRVFSSHRTTEDGSLIPTEGFPANVDRLSIEFITLPFDKQNEVWNSLRTTYRPSVLFKLRMLAFQQSSGPITPKVKEKEIHVQQSPHSIPHYENRPD